MRPERTRSERAARGGRRTRLGVPLPLSESLASPLRVLFVCSRNRLRSPTAESVVADWPGVEAVSAGTAPDAEARVSADLVEWADVVVAFEASHRRRLLRAFGPLLADTRVVVLGIPDDYAVMDPALVRLLRDRLPPVLGLDPPA